MIVEININLLELAKNNLTVNEYLTLVKIKDRFVTYKSTIDEINSLKEKGFVDVKEEQIYLLDPSIKLMQKYDEGNTNFDELFELYPAEVDGRILRSKSIRTRNRLTENYKTCRDKYNKKIKTQEEHEAVINGTKNMISLFEKEGRMKYLQNLVTFINQNTWEQYENVEVPDNDVSNQNWELI